ncbi:hypothetical protein BJV78DRAFT_1287712 [Lactifluus subvellereus]|nr:hypothetical protein BJV78DRAFT_1287712 [Lactifluus subvellereus]
MNVAVSSTTYKQPLSLKTRPRSLISTRPTSLDVTKAVGHPFLYSVSSRSPVPDVSYAPYISAFTDGPYRSLGYCPYSPSLLTCIDRSIGRITAKYWRALMYIKYCGSPLEGHESFIGLLFRQSGLTSRRPLPVERQEPGFFPVSVSVSASASVRLRRRADPGRPLSSRTDRSRAYFASARQVVPLLVSLKLPSFTFELSRGLPALTSAHTILTHGGTAQPLNTYVTDTTSCSASSSSQYNSHDSRII